MRVLDEIFKQGCSATLLNPNDQEMG